MTDITETTEIDCPYCAEKINKMAKKCKHCHEILDQVMRELDAMKTSRKDIYVTNNAASSATSASAPAYARSRKSKGVAFLWCVFLGGIGAHKFYLGQQGWGLLYLVFFWTGIPMLISLVEAVYLVIMSQEDFDRKFNY